MFFGLSPTRVQPRRPQYNLADPPATPLPHSNPPTNYIPVCLVIFIWFGACLAIQTPRAPFFVCRFIRNGTHPARSRFERPVLVGERVDVRIEVERARVTSSGKEVLVRCSTLACLADGAVAVSGQAKVLLPRTCEVRSW